MAANALARWLKTQRKATRKAPKRARVVAPVKRRPKAKRKKKKPTKPRRPTPPAVSTWDAHGEITRRRDLELAVAAEQIENTRLVAVIVPVLGRPGNVRPLVESFHRATPPTDGAIYFVAQASDADEIAAIRDVGLEPLLVGDGDRSWARKINHGYANTTEPWLLLGADDLGFHPGWIDLVRPLLTWFPGVVGTNDLGNRFTILGTHSTHPFVRRLYAQICGTVDVRGAVVHGGYDHNYPDTELCATAKKRGLYVHRTDCIVEHLHPGWGKGQRDAIYDLGARRVHEDGVLFHARARRFGFL